MRLPIIWAAQLPGFINTSLLNFLPTIHYKQQFSSVKEYTVQWYQNCSRDSSEQNTNVKVTILIAMQCASGPTNNLRPHKHVWGNYAPVRHSPIKEKLD